MFAPGCLHGLFSSASMSTSKRSFPFESFCTALTSNVGVWEAASSYGVREPCGTSSGTAEGLTGDSDEPSAAAAVPSLTASTARRVVEAWSVAVASGLGRVGGPTEAEAAALGTPGRSRGAYSVVAEGAGAIGAV